MKTRSKRQDNGQELARLREQIAEANALLERTREQLVACNHMPEADEISEYLAKWKVKP
jgi:hypothetical protein